MPRTVLTPRERIAAALNHREPDRVPWDDGATGRTGLRAETQDRLLERLRVDDRTNRLAHPILGIAEPHEALRERYPADVIGFPTSVGELAPEDDLGEERYEWRARRVENSPDERTAATVRAVDLYGVVWERGEREAAFRPATAPLSGDLPANRAESYPMPEPDDPRRCAPYAADSTRATLVEGLGGGLLETAIALRGRADVLRDLATGSGLTVPLLDRVAEIKRRFWEHRLSDPALRESPPTIILETEQLDVIAGLPMSRGEFRETLLARWRSVFDAVRSLSPTSAVFFFCDAYLHEVLPDLIEAGVSVVNLASTEQTERKPEFMKREYGGSVTFWGGSVHCGDSFLQGTPERARDHVKETLDTFAPGGGFVWSLLPVPEAHTAPENIVAALDTLTEYGLY